MINIKVEKLDKGIQTITNILKDKYKGTKLTTTGIKPGEAIINNPNDLAVTLTISGMNDYIAKIYTQYEGEYRVETKLGTKAFNSIDKAIDYLDKFVSKFFERV